MPIVAAVTAILSALGSALVAMIVWIIERLSFRIVVYTAALIAVSTALTVVYSEFSDYMARLALSLPDSLAQMAMVLPSNTGTCMGIIISAEISAFVYRGVLYIAKTKMDIVT